MRKFVSKYIKVHVPVCHYSLILHVVPGIFLKFPVILFSCKNTNLTGFHNFQKFMSHLQILGAIIVT